MIRNKEYNIKHVTNPDGVDTYAVIDNNNIRVLVAFETNNSEANKELAEYVFDYLVHKWLIGGGNQEVYEAKLYRVLKILLNNLKHKYPKLEYTLEDHGVFRVTGYGAK